jgi:hypothetical protein
MISLLFIFTHFSIHLSVLQLKIFKLCSLKSCFKIVSCTCNSSKCCHTVSVPVSLASTCLQTVYIYKVVRHSSEAWTYSASMNFGFLELQKKRFYRLLEIGRRLKAGQWWLQKGFRELHFSLNFSFLLHQSTDWLTTSIPIRWSTDLKQDIIKPCYQI